MAQATEDCKKIDEKEAVVEKDELETMGVLPSSPSTSVQPDAAPIPGNIEDMEDTCISTQSDMSEPAAELKKKAEPERAIASRGHGDTWKTLSAAVKHAQETAAAAVGTQ